MNFMIFFVLITYVVFVAGEGNAQAITKVLSSSKSTRDVVTEVAIIANYLNSCPAALNHYSNCLTTHNYNPIFDPNNLNEVCTGARIELTCFYSTFATTSCTGLQEAINAGDRMRPEIEAICSGAGSGAVSVIAVFITMSMLSFANLLH